MTHSCSTCKWGFRMRTFDLWYCDKSESTTKTEVENCEGWEEQA